MMPHLSNEGYYNLRSGLTIFSSQQETINQLLTELVQKLPAHFILLTDVTGQIVSTRGEQNQINLVALGSLVAGDLAASQEIARLTGAYQEDQLILRQGPKIHTLTIAAGHHLALFAQVPGETPLGWARLLVQKAAQRLVEIVSVAQPDQQEAQFELELAEENLSDLFNDALDALWQE